ncbi:MAG: hypothetical protein ABI806_01595 [Candidatus Solibacter sp.]
MTSFFRFSTLTLNCAFSAWASSYTLYSISNKPALTADHVRAFDVAVSGALADRAGNIYLTGRGPSGATIFKVGADAILLPFAGQGSGFLSTGDRMPAVLSGSLNATQAAVDASGNVFLAGGGNGFTRTSIYRVTPDGMISIYIVAPLSWTEIFGMAADGAGNLYVLAGSSASQIASESIVRIAPDLTMTTVRQMAATAIAADDVGTLYVANRYTSQIVKLDTAGNLAPLAQLDSIARLALDRRNGNLYVSQDNAATVRRVAPDGSVTVVAGNGTAAYGGDGGPATSASLAGPGSVTVDPAGNLYIEDAGRVRAVDSSGVIRTFAGCACGGDGVPVAWVRTGFPLGVAVDPQGNVYYSDRGTHLVRKIALDGTAIIVAGTGESGFTGDLGPARQARGIAGRSRVG